MLLFKQRRYDCTQPLSLVPESAQSLSHFVELTSLWRKGC